MKCGLLGEKLGHSYSPQIHACLGAYPYSLYEVAPENLADFLKNGDFTGLNVTIPYKKAVIPFCHSLTPRAQMLGAVNTLVKTPEGTLLGHNTDYFGFETMVLHSGLDPKGKKALVLGSGGASNTAVAVLREMGAEVVVISRKGENHYGNLCLHSNAKIIVNTTPVGMYPDTLSAPLSLSHFPQLEGVLDCIYNPANTLLLQEAENRGLVAENGLLMLVAQAAESSQWFTGTEVPREIIYAIYQKLKQQMENIVLVGMPGSGKTTVGKLLAKHTEKAFVDADATIEEKVGKPIPAIFAEDGEAAFRALETQVLEELGKNSGIVLSTGGGCVTREENRALLRQNGTVFCLNRALNKLETQGRPLSQSTNLTEMYRVRKPLYEHFAQHHIDNNDTPEAAAQAIMTIWEANV